MPLNDGSSWTARDRDLDSDEEEEDEEDARGSILDSDGGLNGESRGRTQEPLAA